MIIPTPAWLTAALDSLRAADIEGFVAMYDDDAVHEIPLARHGRPDRVEGRAAIADYLKALPRALTIRAFYDVVAHDAGDELIVEAKSTGTRVGNDEPFRMRYVWFIQHQGGRVSRFRDYTVPEQGPFAGGHR